ncbi:MAG: ABC transporter substrate-binding protein [Chloroflexota bacterium]
MHRLTRREFLALSSATAGLGLLQACAQPAAPTATTAPQATEPPKPAAATQAPKPAATAPAASTKAAAGTPKRGGTFTLGCGSSVVQFNPYWLGPQTDTFRRVLFNTLTRYDAQFNLQPELAEKWDFSADGKTVTLKLREGVKFHSGREFTSDDVRFSLGVAQTGQETSLKTVYTPVKQIETPDKYTVIFRFDKVDAVVFDMLDMFNILDKETWEDRGKVGIGTGPFKLDKYVPNDRVELVANKDYWDKGKPYLDRYIIRQIPDLASLAVNLESGAIDCAWQPSNVDLERFANSGGKFVADMGVPGAFITNIALNVKQEPFTDKRVRQAIAWSIDRARFCKTAVRGLVQPTCLMWPTHSWAYHKDLEGKIGYDLEKARALLKEAGLEKGFETEILSSAAQSPDFPDLGTILQADLKKINVNARLLDLESPVYLQHLNQKTIKILLHAYGRGARDPGSLLVGAKAWYPDKAGGWTRFVSEEWVCLRTELQSTLDRSKRIPITRKLQEMALDECFIIPVAPNQRPYALTPYVKNFTYNMDNCPYVVG